MNSDALRNYPMEVEERAAILEFEGNLPRVMAERLAIKYHHAEMKARRARANAEGMKG